MSNLQVNNIQPYSGDTLTLSGSFVEIPGVLTVDTSITSSGDLRFPNMGTGVVNPVTDVSASGTSSLNINGISTTNTATFLNYGINVINYATAENYCVKLPSTPTKGKELTIVNLSGIPIYLFPGVEGGSVNGIIGDDAVIPSDGIAYKFVCWENPLPGSWSLVSSGVSTTVQSDIIDLQISQSVIPNNYYFSAHAVISNNIYALGGNGLLNSNQFSYDLLSGNNPLHEASINFSDTFASNYAASWLTPDPNVRKINSITLYTNLSSSYGSSLPDFLDFRSNYSYNIAYYEAGTTNREELLLDQPGNIIPAAYTAFETSTINPFLTDLNLPTGYGGLTGAWGWFSYGGTFNSVPGTLTPIDPNYIPLSQYDWTGYLSANPGDPGTTYYNWDLSSFANNNNPLYAFGKGSGMTYIGTVTTPGVEGASVLDAYFLANFGFQFSLDKRAYIDGLKLKIVVNYEPL